MLDPFEDSSVQPELQAPPPDVEKAPPYHRMTPPRRRVLKLWKHSFKR